MVSNIQGVASNYVSRQTAVSWRMYSDQVVLQYKWSSPQEMLEKHLYPQDLAGLSLFCAYGLFVSRHFVFNIYCIELSL